MGVPGNLQAQIDKTQTMATATTGFALTNLGNKRSRGRGGGGRGENMGKEMVQVINSISCPIGSECYKTKQNDRLKEMLDSNQKIANTIPLDLSQAEKNYYVYNGGNSGGREIYGKLIIDRFASTAAEFKKNSIDRQQQFMSDLLQSIKQYQSALLFQTQMTNLLRTKENEYNNLFKNVNYYQKVLQTSERKAVYENKNMDSLYLYRRILIFLYYACLVCFIIFGNFIPDKLYTKWSVWLIIVIVAVIPIILNMLMMWVFLLYDTLAYWFAEIPYKDVYFNMGNPGAETPPESPPITPPAPTPPPGGAGTFPGGTLTPPPPGNATPPTMR
jgi:hypothetical protein